MLATGAPPTCCSNATLLLQFLQMSNDRTFCQTMHCRLNIPVDFLHDCGRLSMSALPGSKYLVFPFHSMIEILLNFCLCICHHRTVSWKQCCHRQCLHSFQRIEVRGHMPFRRIDNNRSKTRHQITRDERAVPLLEYADVAPRVSGRVQHAKVPTRFAWKLEPFAVSKLAVDLHHAVQIARGNR